MNKGGFDSCKHESRLIHVNMSQGTLTHVNMSQGWFMSTWVKVIWLMSTWVKVIWLMLTWVKVDSCQHESRFFDSCQHESRLVHIHDSRLTDTNMSQCFFLLPCMSKSGLLLDSKQRNFLEYLTKSKMKK